MLAQSHASFAIGNASRRSKPAEPVVLDTDTLSELSRGHAHVNAHARTYLAAFGALTITAITVFERLRGYRLAIRQGKLLFGCAMAVVAALLWVGGRSSDRPSTCFGTGSRGALRDAWKLPRKGDNFRPYSVLGWLAGRTFVHGAVHEIVVDAYARLAATHPEYKFVYGETGFARGGSFEPHRTHQNGLSVDFMVPVRDATGAPVEIPTSIIEKFGYDLEFNDSGKLGELEIDFEAIALHLAELKNAASRRHAKIVRVIFDPKLRQRLTSTRAWPKIKALPYMTKPAWIRHDEHYHVDFEVPCRPLAELT